MGNQTEIAKAQVFINDKQAEAAISGLRKSAKLLEKELKAATINGDTSKVEKLKKQISALKSITTKTVKETYDYDKILKNLDGSSYNEMTKTLRALKSEYNKLKPKTKEDLALRSELAEKIQRVKTKQAELNNEMRASTSVWSKMSNGFNKYFGMATAGVATITGLGYSIKELISGLTGLDDNLANVMKTTGLTRSEVRGLYTDFKQLNTRTKNSVLLEYAEEAGRLGKKGKEDIMGFVEQANKIGTALGDDLGDTKAAINIVGKLVGMYDVGGQFGVDFNDGMNKIGSAINEIAANSAAAAPYQIDFLKRLAGTSKQAKITADDILGYSSVLDQNGQRVEASATALSKLMTDMFTAPGEYAKYAGVELENFSNLLETDANEAFLLFLEGLNGNNEGFTVMAQKLKDLGVDGDKAKGVLATLAANTQNVRDEQTLANEAMEEGVSLTQEYNIKNDNLAGSWEKIQKKMRSAFLNTTLIESFEDTISKLAASMEDGSFDQFLKFFKNLTVATIAYIAVQKATYKWSQLSYALRKARVITLALFNGKMNLLTKATNAQTTAQKANNTALKANLYAAIAAGVVMLIQKLIQLNKEQIKADKNHSSFVKNLVLEQGKANDLFNTYKKLNPESDAARIIREKLNTLYPELMQNYIDEEGHITDVAAAQKAVNEQIIRTVALRAREDEITELSEKALARRSKIIKKLLSLADNDIEKGALSVELGALISDMEDGTITAAEMQQKIAGILDIENVSNGRNLSSFELIGLNVKSLVKDTKALTDGTNDIENFYNALLGNDTSSVTVKPDSTKEKTDKPDPASSSPRTLAIIDEEIAAMRKLQTERSADAVAYSEYNKKIAVLTDERERITSATPTSNEDIEAWLLQNEVLLLESYATRKIDKQSYDTGMLMLDLEYWRKKAEQDASSEAESLANRQGYANALSKIMEANNKTLLEPISLEDTLGDVDQIKKITEAMDAHMAKHGQLVKQMEVTPTTNVWQTLKANAVDYFETAQELLDTSQEALTIYNDMAAASTTARYEEETTALDKKYAEGLMSETAYDKATTALSLKKEAEEKEQLKRTADLQFALTMGQIVAQTALAIIGTWAGYAPGGPFGVAPAIAQTVAIGALATVQTAQAVQQRQIAKGLETGGYTDVTRAQDGKQFTAKNAGNQRGYIDETSILTAENGPEFMMNNDAVNNPTVKPVLDIMNMAQQNGTARTINLPEAMGLTGLEDGGYTNNSSSSSTDSTTPTATQPIVVEARFALFKDSGVSNIDNLTDAITKIVDVSNSLK